jgi:hypothetical protein
MRRMRLGAADLQWARGMRSPGSFDQQAERQRPSRWAGGLFAQDQSLMAGELRRARPRRVHRDDAGAAGTTTRRTRPRSARRSRPRWESSPRAAICEATQPAARTPVSKIPSSRNRGRSVRRAVEGSVDDSGFSVDSDRDGFRPERRPHLRIHILDRTQHTSTSKRNDQGRKCCKVAG